MAKIKWLNFLAFGALLVTAMPAFAGFGGDNSDHEGPLEDEFQR